MRTFLVGVSAASFVLLGLVACSGGPGDLPTQRSVSLSSGGTEGIDDGTSPANPTTGSGSSKNGGATTQPSCQLGATCDCNGSQGVVTQCSNGTPTCTCASMTQGDAG